jgi:hypothetical protein
VVPVDGLSVVAPLLGVVLGLVPGLTDVAPVEGVLVVVSVLDPTAPVAPAPVLGILLGLFTAPDAPAVASAPDVVVAEVLAPAPVALSEPDHQSRLARCFGEAFR